MYALDTVESDPRGSGILLVAATALFFAISTPQIAEAPSTPLAGGPEALVERVLDWRPQSPPPWGDLDQANSDDTEPVAGPPAGEAPRSRASSDILRSRPTH